ncbi:MAG: porin family protein [Candidatus Eisenbacteria bacterium]
MKRAVLLSIAIGLVLAGSVSAQLYFGVKTGMMMIDVEGIDNIIPIGVMGGHEIFPNASIEGEFNYRITGGDWDYGIPGITDTFEWKIWTLGGYFVYRYPLNESLYLKGKAGILYENVTAEVTYDIPGVGTMTYDASGTDTGLSVGGGLGMNFNERFGGEVEFTLIEADVTYLSVGVHIIP